MRILADENLDGPIVNWLRAIGHDVLWIAESDPGKGDPHIIKAAAEQDRAVITSDRDFGE